jgi:hypothetical protein
MSITRQGLKPLIFGAERHGWIGCGKNTFCHPERSEGSAFLLRFQEAADSSGKPRPSEWHGASFSAACEAVPYKVSTVLTQTLKALIFEALNVTAQQAAEKVIYFVIPSEARNLSSTLLREKKERFLA